ncbi:hypothetical protein BH11ARM1_BH11ARM1_12150 [soil metagenome]
MLVPFQGLAADISTARTDQNSLIAHEQLVQKAKEGGIDIYFVGDSITRRWGTSDKAWKPMLENWTQNFFGWNAGNFGWGADQTQNILWRLQNGELDNVNPKIIVILAGTNNVGAGQSAEEVTKGIIAIIRVCKDKAPAAKVVLTGVFPRNDTGNYWPTIQTINKNLSKLGDDSHLVYLDINDHLADKEGKLFEGMTLNGLHLTTKGYQIWADALKPIFNKFLGPPATTDHAPPPTGDPSAK